MDLLLEGLLLTGLMVQRLEFRMRVEGIPGPSLYPLKGADGP